MKFNQRVRLYRLEGQYTKFLAEQQEDIIDYSLFRDEELEELEVIADRIHEAEGDSSLLTEDEQDRLSRLYGTYLDRAAIVGRQ